MTESRDVHSKLAQFAAAVKESGKPFPARVKEIPEFPLTDFEALKAAVNERRILLQRFSINHDADIFELMASPLEVNLQTLYIALAGIVPLASLVAAYFVSWWFLLGVFGFFIAMSKSKAQYNKVILRAALRGEDIFCFLYATRQVSLATPDFNTAYYWK